LKKVILHYIYLYAECGGFLVLWETAAGLRACEKRGTINLPNFAHFKLKLAEFEILTDL
jgi:cobyrinic acid a,c-diamide synthase